MWQVMRWHLIGVLTLAATTACSDTSSSADVLGIWDVEKYNGVSLPGTVWEHWTPTDSSEADVDAIRFEFPSSAACAFAFAYAGSPENSTDVCSYSLTSDGKITVYVGGSYRLTGQVVEHAMTLTDQYTNHMELARRP